MKLPPPSWGCLYLASVMVASAGFFAFVTCKSWFDETDPGKRLRGEAQYLYRLATRSSGTQRLKWLNEALPVFLQLADAAKVLAILDELGEAGVEPLLTSQSALLEGELWAGGLTADGWTVGTGSALFVVRNTSSEPAHLVLRWDAPSTAERARFRRGRGEWQVLALSRDQGKNLGSVEIPLEPSGIFELISVAAEESFSSDADPRDLGIHLEGSELARNYVLDDKGNHLSLDEVRRALTSGDAASIKTAVHAVKDNRWVEAYPDVFDVYLDVFGGGEREVPSLVYSLQRCVSDMGTQAVPLIEGALNDPRYRRAFPQLAWLLGHLVTRYQLAVLKDERVIRMLKRILHDDNMTWESRLRAAGSLGRGGMTDGYQIALRGLAEPENDFDHMVAGWALGFIGIPDGVERAVPVLLAGLTSSEVAVRAEAVHGLGNLGEKAPTHQKENIAQAIRPLLFSQQDRDRLYAVVALGKIRLDADRAVLQELLVDDVSEEVRMRSAQGLVYMRSKRAIPALRKALSDPSARVRQWSLQALSKIGVFDAGLATLLEEHLARESTPLNRKICAALLERVRSEKQ